MLVTIYAPENVHALEIASIKDALFEANQRMRSGDRYDVRLVAQRADPIRCASGLLVTPDCEIGDDVSGCDTLIVVGPYGVPNQPDEAVKLWLTAQSSRARRYGAICTGAFCLAAAGLLDGRGSPRIGNLPKGWRQNIPNWWWSQTPYSFGMDPFSPRRASSPESISCFR